MVKLFLQGYTYKEIAVQYGLSDSRIGQILDKQARRANYYKSLSNDREYRSLVESYTEKLQRNELIKINRYWEDEINHEMALNEAKLHVAAKGDTEADKFNKQLIIDYAISVTHLYGLVTRTRL